MGTGKTHKIMNVPLFHSSSSIFLRLRSLQIMALEKSFDRAVRFCSDQPFLLTERVKTAKG